jgi:RNA polymerase sigma-70 factor (ECF subfamily)
MNEERRQIAACLRGDKDAWETLISRHHDSVYALAFRLLGDNEVEDVCQEVFIRAYRSLAGFRGDCQLSTWLYRITVNLCRDRLRQRHKRRVAFSLDEPILAETGAIGRQLANYAPTPHETLESSELSRQVADALACLPEIHRTVLILHDMQGLRYEEIAQIMGCSLGTIKSRIFYARRKLGTLLKKHYLG